MNENKRVIKISLIVVIFCSIFVTNSVEAAVKFFTSKDQVVNSFQNGDIDVNIDEKFIPPDNWDGHEYLKEVRIKNNSTAKALIRVEITPFWNDEKGNIWPGDLNYVNLNFTNIDNGDWVYGNDGYYYYTKLVSNDDYTSNILKSVSVNIPDELKERYNNKSLIVDVKSESVQGTKDGYKSTWKNLNSNIQSMLDGLCDKRIDQ